MQRLIGRSGRPCTECTNTGKARPARTLGPPLLVRGRVQSAPVLLRRLHHRELLHPQSGQGLDGGHRHPRLWKKHPSQAPIAVRDVRVPVRRAGFRLQLRDES